MNTFQTQIVKMVREMPDDALLDLVRAEMSNGKPLAFPPKAKAESRPAKAAPKRVRMRKVKVVRKDPKAADKVLHAIKVARRGVSAGDLKDYTKLTRMQLRGALLKLLAEKSIFRAGDRRFTRYATTKALAQKAAKAR